MLLLPPNVPWITTDTGCAPCTAHVVFHVPLAFIFNLSIHAVGVGGMVFQS